ncbi:MAG: polysaccharide deacetylase family protein [Bacteroidota bacterium]
MTYLIGIPWWLKRLHNKGLIWSGTTKHKRIYLSFDDGPHPTITNYVLDLLKEHAIKATFFCIGDNVTKYPETFERIINDGHTVGNHTFHHLNGWKTDNLQYYKNILQAAKYIPSKLFRPPYGKIQPTPANYLLTRGWRIIMWNSLSADFDPSLDGISCFNNVKSTLQNGSIVVFHDSEKAFDRMKIALPLLIQYCIEQQYEIRAL